MVDKQNQIQEDQALIEFFQRQYGVERDSTARNEVNVLVNPTEAVTEENSSSAAGKKKENFFGKNKSQKILKRILF